MKRLTPAFLTMMMFGVVGLLIAAYVAKNLLAVEEKLPEATEDLIPMAIADLAPGTLVTTNDILQLPNVSVAPSGSGREFLVTLDLAEFHRARITLFRLIKTCFL